MADSYHHITTKYLVCVGSNGGVFILQYLTVCCAGYILTNSDYAQTMHTQVTLTHTYNDNGYSLGKKVHRICQYMVQY